MDLAIFVQAEGHSNGKVLKSLSSYIKNSEQRATGRRFRAIYIYMKDKYVRKLSSLVFRKLLSHPYPWSCVGFLFLFKHFQYSIKLYF